MEEGEGLGVSREGRIAQTRLLAKTRVAWFPFGKGARLRDFTFTFHFHALEKEMATHSSVLAWRIPGTEEPSVGFAFSRYCSQYTE